MKKIDDNYNLLKIIIIFTVFFGSISLGQLVGIKTGNFVFYPHDMLALFMFVSWIVSIISSKKSLLQWWQSSRSWLTLFIWILIGWVLATFKQNIGYSAILTAFRLVVYAVAIRAVFHFSMRCFETWQLRAGLFFTTFLMTLWGILQYVLMPDTRFLHIFGWDDHYFRLIGPLLDPNFAGLVALITLLNWQTLFLVKPFRQFLSKFAPIIDASVIAISLIALSMTFSRSSWLAFGVSILISLLFTQAKLLKKLFIRYASWVVFLIICYLLLPKPTGEGIDIARTASVTARTSLVQELTRSWTWSDWIFGRGLFNVRPDIDSLGIAEIERIPNTSRQPDDLLIQLIGSMGIGGILLASSLIWIHRHQLQLNTRFLPLLAAWITHAQFNNSIFQPQLWLLLIALLFCFKHESDLRTY